MKTLLETSPNYSDIEKLYLFNGAIANSNRIYLLTRESVEDVSESEVRKLVFAYQRDAEPNEQLQILASVTPYVFAECEMSYQPVEHLVIYDSGGNKCSIKDGKVFDETDKSRRARYKSNVIGERKYTATISRRVLYRDESEAEADLAPDQTYKSRESFDRPLKEDGGADSISMIIDDGFYDVDGFNEKHIYAVGGKGDVWRCIDGIWAQCAFPSDLKLKNVCCGQDGLVYISGVEGMTFVGKEDDWRALPNPHLSIPFKDVAWYNGKVWATNDYGVWWITQDGIVNAEVPNEVKICSGRLHVNAGMLLLVGMGGAALLEGNDWQILFNNLDAF